MKALSAAYEQEETAVVALKARAPLLTVGALVAGVVVGRRGAAAPLGSLPDNAPCASCSTA